MNLTRFTSPQDFSARAEAFLVAHEAQNNLMLGLAASLAFNPNLDGSQPYLAVVADADAGAKRVLAAALMTPPHRVTLSFNAPREALEVIAQDVHDFRPDTPGVTGPVPVSLQFAEIWQALTGQSFHKRMAERIYRLGKVKPPTGVSGQMRRIKENDRALLMQWIEAFQMEIWTEADPASVERAVNNMLTLPPDYRGTFLWEDPGPVSLTSYGGPTPHSMRIGPVYTPREFRGQGYASACVAAVSQHLLESGRQFCTLFTDLANPTSNKIYMNIGYEPVCDVDEYKFAPA
jgi:predicted GNAT family acetyltransferase